MPEFLIRSPVDAHLGWLRILAIEGAAVASMGVHGSRADLEFLVAQLGHTALR